MTLWQELDQYVSFSIQKDISPPLTGSENSFQLLFHWRYCIMALYALLFIPGSKWWNQLSSIIVMLWRKLVPLTAYYSKNCEEILFFFGCLCSFISSWGIHWAQVFWYSKICTISLDHRVPHSSFCRHIPHCYVLVSSNELIDFSLISFGRGSWRATTAELIASACATVFKMLYTMSDNSSTHANISTCML